MASESHFRSGASLRAALLALGLEDWIPIPEAVGNPEVLETVGTRDAKDAISRALTELVQAGAIQIYRGRWDADPEVVSPHEAAELLKDEQWYSFRVNDPQEERLYFVNVENIRHES